MSFFYFFFLSLSFFISFILFPIFPFLFFNLIPSDFSFSSFAHFLSVFSLFQIIWRHCFLPFVLLASTHFNFIFFYFFWPFLVSFLLLPLVFLFFFLSLLRNSNALLYAAQDPPMWNFFSSDSNHKKVEMKDRNQVQLCRCLMDCDRRFPYTHAHSFPDEQPISTFQPNAKFKPNTNQHIAHACALAHVFAPKQFLHVPLL